MSAGLPSPDSVMAWLGLAGGGAVSSKMDVTLGGGNFMGQGCYAVSLPAALAVAGRTLPLAPHWANPYV